MSKTIYLYTTVGCHLCEMAQAIVQPLAMGAGLTLALVEISEEEALVEKYGIRIPVIRIEDREDDLGWPFDVQQAEGYLVGQN